MRAMFAPVRGVLMAGLGVLAFSGAVSAETIYKVYSDGWVVPITPEMRAQKKALPVSKNLTVNGITFNITYEDVENSTGAGFDDPVFGPDRRARVESALATVAETLNETGELDVEIEESTSLGGSLAQGGTFFSSAVGFTNGSAFMRIQSGSKPFAEPEMFARVDFSHNWYAGSDPEGIGSGQFDLESVMLHEFTHGIGFLSLSDDEGFSAIAPGVFTVWDSDMLRGSGGGAFNLFVGPGPNAGETFQGTPPDLVSNDLFYDGTQSSAAFGGNPPIFAPTTFSSGSSLSHWDTGNVPIEAVMEHAIFDGEVSREYPEFESAALFDIGWTNVEVSIIPADSTPFPEAPEGTPVGGGPALYLLLAALLVITLGIGLRRSTAGRA